MNNNKTYKAKKSIIDSVVLSINEELKHAMTITGVLIAFVYFIINKNILPNSQGINNSIVIIALITHLPLLLASLYLIKSLYFSLSKKNEYIKSIFDSDKSDLCLKNFFEAINSHDKTTFIVCLILIGVSSFSLINLTRILYIPALGEVIKMGNIFTISLFIAIIIFASIAIITIYLNIPKKESKIHKDYNNSVFYVTVIVIIILLFFVGIDMFNLIFSP